MTQDTHAPKGVTVQATIPHSAILDDLLKNGPMQAAVSYAVRAEGGGEASADAALAVIKLLRETLNPEPHFSHPEIREAAIRRAEAALEAVRLWVAAGRERPASFIGVF